MELYTRIKTDFGATEKGKSRSTISRLFQSTQICGTISGYKTCVEYYCRRVPQTTSCLEFSRRKIHVGKLQIEQLNEKPFTLPGYPCKGFSLSYHFLSFRRIRLTLYGDTPSILKRSFYTLIRLIHFPKTSTNLKRLLSSSTLSRSVYIAVFCLCFIVANSQCFESDQTK